MELFQDSVSFNIDGVEVKNVRVVKGRIEKLTEEVKELKTIVSELSYTVDELIKNK